MKNSETDELILIKFHAEEVSYNLSYIHISAKLGQN
jgi:hypothetical protein